MFSPASVCPTWGGGRWTMPLVNHLLPARVRGQPPPPAGSEVSHLPLPLPSEQDHLPSLVTIRGQPPSPWTGPPTPMDRTTYPPADRTTYPRTPGQDHLPPAPGQDQLHLGHYAQASGTHHTEMHSCLLSYLTREVNNF